MIYVSANIYGCFVTDTNVSSQIPYVAKGVDCLPDHFEEEISINGPYGASYDDDEWSNMASSDMGDDLLFEL